MKTQALAGFAALMALATGAAHAADICQGFGPQTPRDISQKEGSNPRLFNLAPSFEKMNLCNIHTHTNAEHKGPGFSIFAGDGEHGGYKCNDSDSLSRTELMDPTHGHAAYHGVKPGDTIEVHWVFTTCDVAPGKGLGSCASEACANPQLRVESQVFLVVNDSRALDFADFAYGGTMLEGLHQAKSLPEGTGQPVVFAGSTTGTSFTQSTCSPYQVTWSVRPQCARLDIGSLNRWAEAGNVFEEEHSHGVRQLVTAPELLAPIQ
ncbi:delta-class carbonic anhydrase [uncultured Cohaesibacter sp.]|uniref:delta-class carbonic anhydrase n=1 Tax=uncultured Cohaesibacter sp. TaxID=1002546 RepID=UPI0029C634E7|nr:delta-class carbonic anhydrase [uncultured Cohaesibacter sp.]